MKPHRSVKWLVISLAAFFGLLIVSLVVGGPRRPVLPFLTVLPAIWAGVEIMRFVTQMDELQQRLVLEAAAFGLANTVLVALAMGMLQISYRAEYNMAFVLPVAALFYGIGFLRARRSYHEE